MGTTSSIDWDFELENQKALFMNYLYEESGRTSGHFTGLWTEYCRKTGEQGRKDFFKLSNLNK